VDHPALTVVTVQTGHRYPDLWVSRLAAMIGRHLAEAHRFIVFTDRPDPGRFSPAPNNHQQLEVRDLQGGGLQGYFGKLRLFDQALTGRDPFLFLDTTLVIRATPDARCCGIRSSPGSGGIWPKKSARIGTEPMLRAGKRPP
jgi:hypothetical protein